MVQDWTISSIFFACKTGRDVFFVVMFNLYLAGIIKLPFWGWIKQCKWMVVFRDFSLIMHSLGWLYYNNPCLGEDCQFWGARFPFLVGKSPIFWFHMTCFKWIPSTTTIRYSDGRQSSFRTTRTAQASAFAVPGPVPHVEMICGVFFVRESLTTFGLVNFVSIKLNPRYMGGVCCDEHMQER